MYEFGPYRLHPEEGTLLRNGKRVPLTPKSFATLVVLLEHRGHLVKKDDLLSQIWPDTSVEEGVLARNICSLRKALGDNSKDKHYIETVLCWGYKFIASVKMDSDLSEKKRTLAKATSQIMPNSCALASSGVIPSDSSHSIAVFPFTMLGPDSNCQNLGMGMTEALVTKLCTLCHIQVISTGAIKKFPGTDNALWTLGQTLGAEWALIGSIQQLQRKIRITIRLLRTSDGRALWADKFDGDFADIFAMQDSISENLAAVLTPRLTRGKQGQQINNFIANRKAYRLYLEGRFYGEKRTADGIEKATTRMRQIVASDPKNATALAALAQCHVAECYYRSISPADSFPRAETAALAALEFGDSAAEAYACLGWVHLSHNRDWARAEKEFQSALDIDHNCAVAHRWYGLFLLSCGRFDEALDSIANACAFDPLSMINNADLGLAYFLAHRYDEAIEHLSRSIRLNPGFFVAYQILGFSLVQQGKLPRGIEKL